MSDSQQPIVVNPQLLEPEFLPCEEVILEPDPPTDLDLLIDQCR